MAAFVGSSGGASSVLPPLSFTTKEVLPGRFQICGKLVHPNGEPLRNKFVTVSGGYFTQQLEFFTDRKGRFSHYAKQYKPLFGSSTTLTYKVFERNVFYIPGSGCNENVQVCSISQKAQIKEKGHNVGNIVARVYEYQKEIPDLEQPEKAKYRPQQWPYTFNLISAAYDETIKSIYGEIGGYKTIQDVQNAFKSTFPDLQVTPKNTIDMILNGIYSAHFRKGLNDNLTVRINWDQYPKKDRPQLPNVEVTFAYKDNQLEIIEIATQLNGVQKNYHKDDPDFRTGLYIFNCAAVLKGEIETHLTRTHFFVGQLAMAVFRSLSDDNPIKIFLAPHLKGVLEINRMGAKAIFGPEGVLSHSGLPPEGIMSLVKHHLGAMCYTTFTPGKPMTNEHKAARCGQRFWGLVKTIAKDLIKDKEEDIRKYWNEIYTMSHNLVSNSAPYHPYDGEENYEIWFNSEELDDPKVPGRVSWDGVLRSMRPVTLNPKEPDEGDLERLEQLCCVALYLGILEHEIRHKSQSKWVSNLGYASIAINGDGSGVMGGTDIEDGIAQLALAHILTDFTSDSLVENQYNDIHQPLINALLANSDAFLEDGLDVKQMSYGIVI